MPEIRIRRPFAAIALAAVVACTSSPVALCGCSFPAAHTIIHGLVTDPAGALVAGALVQAEVGAPGCQALARGQEAATDALGRYRLGVSRGGSEAEMCVRLSARPPAGSSLRGSDTVQLTLPTPTALPPDSVRRDLVLRAP